MSTFVKPAAQFVDELESLIDNKTDPEDWYVLVGHHCTDYSVSVPNQPDEYEEHQESLPPEERDAVPMADGVWQIGTLGWAGDALAEDCNFVSEVSMGGGDVDARLVGTLLVHESMLSDEAKEELGIAEADAA